MNDKATLEQFQLINELKEEDKGIETYFSKKRLKEYYNTLYKKSRIPEALCFNYQSLINTENLTILL